VDGGTPDGFEGEADDLGAVQLPALVNAGAEAGAQLVAQPGCRAAQPVGVCAVGGAPLLADATAP
jgi:hypothetical protein